MPENSARPVESKIDVLNSIRCDHHVCVVSFGSTAQSSPMRFRPYFFLMFCMNRIPIALKLLTQIYKTYNTAINYRDLTQ